MACVVTAVSSDGQGSSRRLRSSSRSIGSRDSRQNAQSSPATSSVRHAFVEEEDVVQEPVMPRIRNSSASAKSKARAKEVTSWQQRLYLLLEDPESSLAAKLLAHFVLGTIILSIASFVLATDPNLMGWWGWDAIEVTSTVIFTVEYLLRLLVCNAFGDQTRLGFARQPMNVLDVLAILPFYVEHSLASLSSVQPLRVLRSTRLIRIFRVFKLGKYSVGMTLMVESLVNSIRPLSILVSFLCFFIVLFSSLLYYAERMFCPDWNGMTSEHLQTYRAECGDSGGWTRGGELCCNEFGSSNEFESIAITFWWSIVTMTTVGYGDMVPKTKLGQLVASVAMLSGIVVISLPVAIVGTKFQQAYEHREQLLAEEAGMKKHMDEKTDTRQSWEKARTVIQVLHVEEALKRRIDESRNSSTSDLATHSRALKEAEERHRTTHQLAPIRGMLKALETKGQMSEAAENQIQLLFELFDHIEKVDKQLKCLREKDKASDACVRADFLSLARSHDAMHGPDVSPSMVPSMASHPQVTPSPQPSLTPQPSKNHN